MIAFSSLLRPVPGDHPVPGRQASGAAPDPRGRSRQSARARAFRRIACDIHPVNNLRVLAYLTQQLGIDEESKGAWYRHWIAEGFTAAESLLNRCGDGPYCVGGEPTLADCCLVPQVANAQRLGCDLGAYPGMMSVFDHSQREPAFSQASPSRQPDYVGPRE